MKFTDLEKSAIMCGLAKLAYVDGNLAQTEKNLYMQISGKLGANEYNIRLASDLEQNPAKAIKVVQSFSQEKKELYSALLYKMMNADGMQHLSEEGFIEGTQIFYDLPQITSERADKLFNDFITNRL